MDNDNQDTIENEEAKDFARIIEECKKERDEYLDGWKRAKADFLNYKKEEEGRLRNIVHFGQEMMVQDLISVLDSFELGLMSWKEESVEKKGMTLVRIQLEDILKKYGLERIIVECGLQFNPSEQECIELVEMNKTSGEVIEEVERGYKLHGKVVRPARVKVAK